MQAAKLACKIRARGQQKYDAFWVSGPKNTISKRWTHFRKEILLFLLLINDILRKNTFTIN